MNSRMSSNSRRRLTPVIAGVLGLALAAPAAWAQPYQGRSTPAATTPTAAPADGANSGAVVVHAPPSKTPPSIGLPPDKQAAYDAAALNDQAWRNYRDAVPPVTESTMDMANAYPGLRAYVPSN